MRAETAAALWGEGLGASMSPATVRAYRGHVQAALREIAGAREGELSALELDQLTRSEVRAHLARYRQEPDRRYREAPGGERSPASVRQRLKALRAFDEWVGEEDLGGGFTRGVRVPTEVAGGAGGVGTCSLEEGRAVLEAAGSGRRSGRDAVLCGMQLTMGLSVGEIAALRVRDVDLGNGVVHVGGVRRRSLSCTPVVREALEAWLAASAHGEASRERALLPGGSVTLQRAVRRVMARAGVEGTSQRLRASYAQLALESGVSVAEVRRHLGVGLDSLRRMLPEPGSEVLPTRHPLGG